MLRKTAGQIGWQRALAWFHCVQPWHALGTSGHVFPSAVVVLSIVSSHLMQWTRCISSSQNPSGLRPLANKPLLQHGYCALDKIPQEVVKRSHCLKARDNVITAFGPKGSPHTHFVRIEVSHLKCFVTFLLILLQISQQSQFSVKAELQTTLHVFS